MDFEQKHSSERFIQPSASTVRELVSGAVECVGPAALLSSHHESPDFDTQLNAAIARVGRANTIIADAGYGDAWSNGRVPGVIVDAWSNGRVPGVIVDIDGADIPIEQPAFDEENMDVE